MSAREVIFLGTASQVPTKIRNHNAIYLRWDTLGILFDPGEGTQRQMAYAGLASSQITHIVITHFHGDHCLGLAALFQRISLDRVEHPIEVIYPKSGQVYYDRLRYASIYQDHAKIIPRPFDFPLGQTAPLQVAVMDHCKLYALPLEHRVDCYGYRLVENDGRKMDKEALDKHGVTGPLIKKLMDEGTILINEKTVHLKEVSEFKKGQIFSLIMDTRPCQTAVELARDADMLVSESTYLSSEEKEAYDHYHMTAAQAARLAQKAQVKRLVLTHFSQRYLSVSPFYEEARLIFPSVIAAKDLCLVAVPKRQEP